MKRTTFFGFVTPSLVVMVGLMVLPLFASLILGLHRITIRNLRSPAWIGLQNYEDVLTDPRFWDSLEFTLIFIAATVPVRMVLGLAFALLLDQIVKWRGFFIAGSPMPFVLTPVVGTLIFRDLFDIGGPLAYVLNQLFDFNMVWNTINVRILIILHSLWVSTPFAMIVFFAGLQTLPKERLEAARVDGASWLKQLRYIAIPHLYSLFVFVALISTMDSYRVLDSVLVLTRQNPLIDARTVMYYSFLTAVEFRRWGKANAMSIITVVGIFIVLIPFLIMTYRDQLQED